MSRSIGRTGALATARRAWSEGRPLAGLPGDALAWALAALDPQGPGLIIVDEADAAEALVAALRFFDPSPGRVELFPADDGKPYDGFGASPDVPAARARVRHRLARGDALRVVAPVGALLRVVPEAVAEHVVTVGDVIARDALIEALTAAGYLASPTAGEPGHFSVRGDVVDVWSAGLPAPRRIDFFDDEVETVRVLDPASLRPVKPARRALILPAREEPLDATALRRAAVHLGEAVAAQARGLSMRRRVLEDLKAGVRFSTLEDWLPALTPCVAPLDAMPVAWRLVVHPSSVGASARELHAAALRRWASLDEDERPLVPATERYVPVEDVLAALEGAHRVHELAGPDEAVRMGAEDVGGLAVRGADLGPTARRLEKLAADDVAVALVAPTARRASALEDLLAAHTLRVVGRAAPEDCRAGEVSVLVGELPRGFLAPRAGVAFIPTTALFGAAHRTSRRAHDLFDASVGSLSALREGDPVVHKVHGIGRFEGLQRLVVHGAAQDFLRLVYRGGDVMYLPATALGELSRYAAASDGGEVRLDRLGGATWSARKDKVRDALLAAAQGLIETAAARQLASRPPHPAPGPVYRAFEGRFEHTETPDQAAAIVDVHEDLSGDTPMDRLLCGDVGFGKTEVAMRAAVRVVQGGQQVAFLCPTTVLAFQHLLTLRKRFEGLPIRVEMLSRFTPPADARDALAGLADGAVDVVVGTHKLLGRGVRFARLGLAVVDEEHRFGVKQKERLKALRTEVDVLSMSATPIPRTLQQALGGLRALSVMATPPTDRLSVRTTIARFTESRVADAIRLELGRGGQVYVIHNRIESIRSVAERVETWVPEARVRVAHGKMSGEALERLLVDFMARRFDVLVSTAIVETGIDLPNVNTMLIDRADLFGLSQLYQLRGRVGRSNVRGNCLLLTPETLSADARKRLQVLVDNTALGSGFAVAAADLELRGGGNLLGTSQSGHIDAVGYETWIELLQEAVGSAQGRAAATRVATEVEVPVDAYLPEELLPDVQERIGWYRKLSAAPTEAEVEAVLDDLEAERGPLPEPARALGELAGARLVAQRLGIMRVGWAKVRVSFDVHPAGRLDEAALRTVAATAPKRFEVTPAGPGRPLSFAARFTPTEAERPLRYVRWVLARLEGAG